MVEDEVRDRGHRGVQDLRFDVPCAGEPTPDVRCAWRRKRPRRARRPSRGYAGGAVGTRQSSSRARWSIQGTRSIRVMAELGAHVAPEEPLCVPKLVPPGFRFTGRQSHANTGKERGELPGRRTRRGAARQRFHRRQASSSSRSGSELRSGRSRASRPSRASPPRAQARGRRSRSPARVSVRLIPR